MPKLIDADSLEQVMYHEAFEKDSDMQKWDSGCWIRYKLFENVLAAQPAADIVRHGHWVEDDFGRLFNDHYCSLCNHYALRDGLGFECLTGWCGNCGAKMDEEAKHAAD